MTLAMGVSTGTVSHYALGLFVDHVVEDLRWTRGGVSTAVSLHLICVAISVPTFGYLVDRFGARRPAVISIILFSSALAATAAAPNRLAFLILLPLAGLVGGGTNVIPYVVTIASRFERDRGLALGIGAAGIGLGGIILPRFVESFIEKYGWRCALASLAILIPLVALPGAVSALDRKPPVAATRGRSTAMALSALGRVRAFRLIAISIFLLSIAVGGVMVHAASLLADRGTSGHTAAQVISLMGLASMVGRVGGGCLMDRYHAPKVSAAFFALAAVGLFLLIFPTLQILAVFGLICLGFTVGAEADVISYLSIRYLSLPDLGGSNGILISIFTIASALGVALLGYLYDALSSYAVGLSIGAVFALVAAASIAKLGPYTGANV